MAAIAPDLWWPWTSQMVESRSIVIGWVPGPAPAAHALPMMVSATRSSWLMWPKVNERRNLPSVEGAITWWPSTLAVEPVRSRSASSMQSPPAIRRRGSGSEPCGPAGGPRDGRQGRPAHQVTGPIPRRSARVAGSSRPALVTRGRHRSRRRGCQGCGRMASRKCPPGRDQWTSQQRHSRCSEGLSHIGSCPLRRNHGGSRLRFREGSRPDLTAPRQAAMGVA